VSYVGVTSAVTASIDGLQNDRIGTRAAGTINTDVENLTGGSGNDTLRGGPAGVAAFVDGGPGADILYAGTNGSGMSGGTGDDRLLATAGKSNVISGGLGVDQLVGSTGADWLFAKDGVGGDRITCGAGDDWAEVDRNDTIVDPQNCEQITYG